MGNEIESFPAGRNRAFEPYETSDDTALTLVVAEALIEHGPGAPAAVLLRRIASVGRSIRGIGPSTAAALERVDRDPTAVYADGGATNGAAMRALPIGWALPPAAADARRTCALEWSRTTHGDADACAAAAVIAACASHALDGATPATLLAAAADEADRCAREVGSGRLVSALHDVEAGVWAPPRSGVGLDAVETVAAVLHCATAVIGLREAMVRAVELGGDTDTVAALVGGLLACRMAPDDVRAALPWLGSVRVTRPDHLEHLARGLATLRVGAEASLGDAG